MLWSDELHELGHSWLTVSVTIERREWVKGRGQTQIGAGLVLSKSTLSSGLRF